MAPSGYRHDCHMLFHQLLSNATDFTPNGLQNSYTLRHAFFGNSQQLQWHDSVHLSSVSTDSSVSSVFFATLFFHCSLYVWLWCWFLICIFDMWTVRSSVSCKWMMHNVKRVSRFVLQLVAVVSTQITNVVYSSSICCSCSVCRPFSRKTRDSLPVDPLLPSGIYCKTYVWLHGVPDANHQVSSFFCPSYRNQCHCVFLCCLCKYQ